MSDPEVIIAGAGIGGLSLALTLHQIGIDCVVYESVRELKPLGVGINLQPNAVRELYDLGFSEVDLDAVGVQAREWALVGTGGQEIYAEARGLEAGYKWPQYAVHRGKLQMALARRLYEVAGDDVIQTGSRVTGYEAKPDNSVCAILQTEAGEKREAAKILIGADGIHSAIRTQMHPDQGHIQWGGALMWRGTSLVKPYRTGSSFLGLGTHKQRMVIYPITPPDPETGLALTNWIAEVTLEDPSLKENVGWFRQVSVEDFVHHFEDWVYDWIDVPAMIRGADVAYENLMIDRDPVPSWVDGPVLLVGDAAHAMYPTGSNGASQAIMDARILGKCFLEHGVNSSALKAFDDLMCEPVSALVLRNRGAGPFGLLNMVDERCGGEFANIDDVIPEKERNEFMLLYKSAAGFARDELNASEATIPGGAMVAGS